MILFRQNFCVKFYLFLKSISSKIAEICIDRIMEGIFWSFQTKMNVGKWINRSTMKREASKIRLGNETLCLLLSTSSSIFFSSQIKWETKLILFDTICFAETRVEYYFLTPKWVRNFGDNKGKKVDTQNVDLPKNVVFFMRAEFWLRLWILRGSNNTSSELLPNTRI